MIKKTTLKIKKILLNQINQSETMEKDLECLIEEKDISKKHYWRS